jgi:general secretion pathway protein M
MMAGSPSGLRVGAPLAEWWSGKSPRERFVVAALGVVTLGVVLWLGLWQPLVRDIAAKRSQVDARTAALDEARRMAAEIAALSRQPVAATPADDRADFDRVLARHGVRGAAAQIGWQDGRVHVVFGAIGYGSLVELLDALQREARLRVIEATLTARVEPGSVRAELTLAR